MNKIITARDVAVRDNQPSVREWIRITSIQLKMKGGCPAIFDGSITGAPVYAYISNGRWMGVCDQPHCNGCEYVDPEEKVFYCLTCGNGGSGKGRPVVFPARRKEIEEALLEREMMPVGGGDVVTQAFNERPAHAELRRDWAPGELAALKNHPALAGRVIVDIYGESPALIHGKTEELKNHDNL